MSNVEAIERLGLPTVQDTLTPELSNKLKLINPRAYCDNIEYRRAVSAGSIEQQVPPGLPH